MFSLRKKNSVLFVRPDYHCSFFYKAELEKIGWKADIFVGAKFPKMFLYSPIGVIGPRAINRDKFRFVRWINHIILIFWWFLNFWRYKYHVYYGLPPIVDFLEKKIGLCWLFGDNFMLELWLSKKFGVKLIFLPTGCHEEETKENFLKLDKGNVCNNCGFYDRCDDMVNKFHFSVVRRYFDAFIGGGFYSSKQFKMTHLKYKAMDLELWSPKISIPEIHRLPMTKNLRILHPATIKEDRSWQNRNIKGTPYIVEAIERLKDEGHAVEFIHIDTVHISDMRYYQAQADIVVDELIYGWWGSTGVECLTLGKPFICYLRPSWKQFFLSNFTEYSELPVIEANINNIYEVLKKVVTDKAFREEKGKLSRVFAKKHFSPKRNTQQFSKFLERLA